VGTSIQYLVNGLQEAQDDRATRTRPPTEKPNDSQDKKGTTKRVPRALRDEEYRQQQLSFNGQFLQEFRLMRQGHEVRSDRNFNFFKSLAEKNADKE